jgi:hypothetical protein
VSIILINKNKGHLPRSISAPTVPCCDICCPELLDLTRPGPPTPAQRNTAVKTGIPNYAVKSALHEWRKKIWGRDFKGAAFGPSGFLKNETLEALSSVGPITRLIELERVLDNWTWFGKYGNELLDEFATLTIAPMQPKPKRKRAGEEKEWMASAGDGGGRKAKRPRTSHPQAAQAPTPVRTSGSFQWMTPEVPQSTPVATSRIPYLPPPSLAMNPYASLLTPTRFTAASPVGSRLAVGTPTPMSSRQTSRAHPYRRDISYEFRPYVPDPGPSSDD